MVVPHFFVLYGYPYAGNVSLMSISHLLFQLFVSLHPLCDARIFSLQQN
jgi:hypothetical protein